MKTRKGGPRGVVMGAAVALALALLSPSSAMAADSNGGVKIMPLGDSITEGYSVPGGYRIGLWQHFTDDASKVDFVGSASNGPSTLGDHDHEGHSGYTISQIAANIDAWLASAQPRTVLLHIGTNDIGSGVESGAPDRLSGLIDKILADVPAADVFVASIIPNSDAGKEAKTQTYNAAIPGIVAAKGSRVHFVDMHSALTTADLYDGIHPNAAGYDKMADAWYAALRKDNLARLATASATTVNSNFPVTRLNDRQDQTGYLSADNPSFPQYATLKWVSGQTFNTVNLKSAWSQGQAPKNWDIEVSDDGDTGWTKVASSGDVTWSKNDSTVETKTVKFATVRNKKGVRLKVNSAYLSWNHYYITEFEVFKSNEALDAVASTTHDPVYGYGINRVNDGRDSTSNLSPDNPTLPQYITLRWDQARTVGNVGLKAFYAQGQAPTSWDVEVSDDGTTNWRRVAQSGTVVWQYNDATVESKYVNFNQETVKGLRVKINTANLQWKHYAVNEIEAY